MGDDRHQGERYMIKIINNIPILCDEIPTKDGLK